jgi:hypothetical protein
MSADASPLPYREVTDDAYSTIAAAAFDLEEPLRGRTVLHGPCPRCAHPMTYPIPVGIVAREAAQRNRRSWAFPHFRRRTTLKEAHVWPVICTCRGDHPGRDGNDEGCGAFWVLRILDGPP